MKNFIPFLIILISQNVFSQSVFDFGDRIFYDTLLVKDWEVQYGKSSTYTKYDIKGTSLSFDKRDLSTGKRQMYGSLFTHYFGIGDRILNPIILGGQCTYYAKPNQAFWGVKVGDRNSSIWYHFRGNKLDGLHKIGAHQHYWDYSERRDRFKWVDDRDYFVAIAGNVVDSRSNGSTSNNWDPKKAPKFRDVSLDVFSWLKKALNTDLTGLPEGWWSVTIHEEELYYDLEKMVEIFLNDFRGFLMDFRIHQAIRQRDDEEYSRFEMVYYTLLNELNLIQTTATFENLDGSTLALSYGMNDDERIIIKVDPDNWLSANAANKWYILYHELGHDVLNFKHGQGGRMMFNYPTKNYSWDDFFKDRNEMFLKAILKEYPVASRSELLIPDW